MTIIYFIKRSDALRYKQQGNLFGPFFQNYSFTPLLMIFQNKDQLVRCLFDKNSKMPRASDFSAIVTSFVQDPLDTIKRNIKDICRSNFEVSVPDAVVVTNFGQLILKVKTRSASERLRLVLVDSDNLKDRIKVIVPRRHNRILITNVDLKVNEEIVRKLVNKLLNAISRFELGDLDKDMHIRGIATKTEKNNCPNWG